MLAALCFVVGSLGSALGESKWSPELMDFTTLGSQLLSCLEILGTTVQRLQRRPSKNVPEFLRNFIGILVLHLDLQIFFGGKGQGIVRGSSSTASMFNPMIVLWNSRMDHLVFHNSAAFSWYVWVQLPFSFSHQ